MSDESGYELDMPFVAVQSNGGHYDDRSFAAGWACAQLDAMLAAQPAEVTTALPIATIPQADLIAMRHGFLLETVGPYPDDHGPHDLHEVTITPHAEADQ